MELYGNEHELLLRRDAHEARLREPFNNDADQRIKSMNAIRGINEELRKRGGAFGFTAPTIDGNALRDLEDARGYQFNG
jgi:hypothetical protein